MRPWHVAGLAGVAGVLVGGVVLVVEAVQQGLGPGVATASPFLVIGAALVLLAVVRRGR